MERSRLSHATSGGVQVRPRKAKVSSTAQFIPARVDSAIPLDPRHILVGLLCPIGDTLFATPALAALRARFPLAHITALVYRSNTGILDGNPAIDQRLLVDAGKQELGLVRLARGVGAIDWTQFDLMINFSPAASFVGFLGGVRDQVHLKMPRHWWLIGGHEPDYRAQHATDHYLHVVQPLLADLLPHPDRQPRVYLSPEHRAAAGRLLRRAGLQRGQSLVAMHVGGDGFRGRKRWSTARFAEVGNYLVDRLGMRVLLLGGPTDRTLSEDVAAAMPRGAVVLAGRTSLMETAALIERSALFIGNDSCPLHIAAAVGTPSVGIFGPSSVEQFHPIGGPGYRYRVVQSGLACSPCFQFVGNDAPWVPNLCYSYACLKAIQPRDVIAAAASLLAEDGSGDVAPTPALRDAQTRPR